MKEYVFNSEAEWLDARRKVVTATEAAALLGVSPYHTAFSLYHEKRGTVDRRNLDENERVKWGHRLETPIAMGWAEDVGASVRRLAPKADQFHFAVADDDVLGCSIDFAYVHPEREGQGVLEVKNLDSLVFRMNWADEAGDFEPPHHILVQGQTQLGVTQWKHGTFVALSGGNQLLQYEFGPVPKVIATIQELASDFLKAVKTGREPDPDGNKETSRVISEMLKTSIPYDPPLDMSDDRALADLLAQRELCRADLSKREAVEEEITNKIKLILQDTGKAICGDWNISFNTVAATIVPQYERKAYRPLNIRKRPASAKPR